MDVGARESITLLPWSTIARELSGTSAHDMVTALSDIGCKAAEAFLYLGLDGLARRLPDWKRLFQKKHHQGGEQKGSKN